MWELLNVQEGTFKRIHLRGAWVAQSVERLTLGFGSGHDFTVCGIDPHIGLHAEHGVCLGSSLSLSLCPLPFSLSLSLSPLWNPMEFPSQGTIIPILQAKEL